MHINKKSDTLKELANPNTAAGKTVYTLKNYRYLKCSGVSIL
jgi:hypothetical protein